MAAPTLQQVAAVARQWWRQGRPRNIDLLRARVAALWTDPRSSVQVVLIAGPPVALAFRLEQRDANGVVINTATRTATKDDLDPNVADDFDDIQDDGQSSARERRNRDRDEAPGSQAHKVP